MPTSHWSPSIDIQQLTPNIIGKMQKASHLTLLFAPRFERISVGLPTTMKLFRLPLHFSLLVFVDSFHVQSTHGNVRKIISMSNSDHVEQGVSRRTFGQIFGGVTIASIFMDAPKEAMAFQPCKLRCVVSLDASVSLWNMDWQRPRLLLMC